ncbi:hypothetical protein FJZ36_18600 [Candidatus Poribacteria bacterium]|nr:hypothetical protein [Candidatus Poribacteria bacterium]
MKRQLVCGLALALICGFAIVSPAHAVKKLKYSNVGGGAQVWFEAEDFDARDSDKYYKLRKAEANLPLEANANGDAITNAQGAGTPPTAFLRYNFNISVAGGKAGTWYLWARAVIPANQSDWLWIKGEQGNTVPTTTFDAPDTAKHRVFEQDVPPPWAWMGGKAKGEGHVRPLLDGDNVMVVFWRQSDNTDQFDTFMWADKEGYTPTDADYKAAKEVSATAVDPRGRAATAWALLKTGF